MTNHATLISAAAAVLALAGAPRSQCPPIFRPVLDLQVDGGSFPGQLTLSLALPNPQPLSGVIFFGFTPGPTNLALVDPNDPRCLFVGTQILQVNLVGGLVTPFTPPPIPVPNLPALLDAPLFMHGASFPGTRFLIDELSLPRAVRFAPSGQFRDRGVALQFGRSFLPIIDIGDGRKLMPGGGNGAITNHVGLKTTEIFDPITDSFATGPDMTVERSIQTTSILPDGKVLLAGGVEGQSNPLASAELFDPVAMTFTATGSMATPRLGHTATVLPSGKVLVAGGLNQVTNSVNTLQYAQTSTEIYDPQSGTFTTGPNMRVSRAAHVAITLPDGKVMIAGGLGWNVVLPWIWNLTDIYDPATNQFSPGPNMTLQRGAFGVAEIAPGRWLFAGGSSNPTQQGAPTNQCDIYDFTTNSFTATGSMSQTRALFSVFAAAPGKLIAVGGLDGGILTPLPLQTTEIYDIAAGTWSNGPPLSIPRGAYGAYLDAAGNPHIVGGSGPNGSEVATEWFYR